MVPMVNQAIPPHVMQPVCELYQDDKRLLKGKEHDHLSDLTQVLVAVNGPSLHTNVEFD